MSQSIQARNKALVLEAFDTLFNKRDYARAERYWSPDYVQHSAHIAPGREGLFNLIKSIPPTLKYEPGVIAAERRLRDCSRAFFRLWRSRELDCGGHCAPQGWNSGRALGCHSRRSDAGGVEEWKADVRRHISGVRVNRDRDVV